MHRFKSGHIGHEVMHNVLGAPEQTIRNERVLPGVTPEDYDT